jgi:aspartyl-tRNA synthetase
MSFVVPEDVYSVVERVVVSMFREAGIELATPFPRMGYTEAIDRFGIDRPDMRFGMELRDAGVAAADSGFAVFQSALDAGGAVRGLAVPGAAGTPRRRLDEWTARSRELGAKGLIWIKLESSGELRSSALKVLGEERCRAIAEAVGATPGDLSLVVADSTAVTHHVLGQLRLEIAGELDLIPKGAWAPLWVEDFPLLDWDAADKRWVAIHHPFTAPRWDEVAALESDPGNVRSQAYDLVLNGTEIAGGSIRIHRRDVQEKVFEAMGIEADEAEQKFGFLLRALRSGAPPHGGIAFGFDRICAMVSGSESIRDVIAFPKTTSASCLMTGSPSQVDDRQLTELGLQRRDSEEA